MRLKYVIQRYLQGTLKIAKIHGFEEEAKENIIASPLLMMKAKR